MGAYCGVVGVWVVGFEIARLNQELGMPETWVINSKESCDRLCAHLPKRFERNKYIRVEIFDTARSLDQNRMFHELYERIGKAIYGGDGDLVRRECKLNIGAKIMRRDDSEYAALYDLVIRPLPHETKLKAMDLWPVTRDFDTIQASEYIDRIVKTYSDQVDFGWMDKK